VGFEIMEHKINLYTQFSCILVLTLIRRLYVILFELHRFIQKMNTIRI